MIFSSRAGMEVSGWHTGDQKGCKKAENPSESWSLGHRKHKFKWAFSQKDSTSCNWRNPLRFSIFVTIQQKQLLSVFLNASQWMTTGPEFSLFFIDSKASVFSVLYKKWLITSVIVLVTVCFKITVSGYFKFCLPPAVLCYNGLYEIMYYIDWLQKFE